MYNRLKGQTSYLSGSIDKATDLGAGWRDWITPRLEKYEIIIYNPLKKSIKEANETDFRDLRKQWKDNGEYEKLREIMKEIRHYDLRAIDKSDFGIFYLDLDIPACGSYEELFTMNRQYKPCLVVCKQTLGELNDWIFGTLPIEYLFSNFDDMFKYLDKIDQSTEKHKRWVFFNE